jgi:hypothetical protein
MNTFAVHVLCASTFPRVATSRTGDAHVNSAYGSIAMDGHYVAMTGTGSFAVEGESGEESSNCPVRQYVVSRGFMFHVAWTWWPNARGLSKKLDYRSGNKLMKLRAGPAELI